MNILEKNVCCKKDLTIFAYNQFDMQAFNTDKKKSSLALLSSDGDMSSFRYGFQNIRFRTSPKLERYTSVKEWDNGYIVVMAKYKDIGEIEDYIDLVPILQNLYIDPHVFLKPIKSVEIRYVER